MMRIRSVKPDFFRHEGLYELEQSTGLPIRLAYEGLWSASDREGRFAWKPGSLKLDILPFDILDFSRVLDALLTRDYLVKYALGDEVYGWVKKFRKHQIINNRESPSRLPAPDAKGVVILSGTLEVLTSKRIAHACPTRDPRDDHATTDLHVHAPVGVGNWELGIRNNTSGIIATIPEVTAPVPPEPPKPSPRTPSPPPVSKPKPPKPTQPTTTNNREPSYDNSSDENAFASYDSNNDPNALPFEPEIKAIKPLRIPAKNSDELYTAIWDSFLLVSKRFTDYAKEGSNCKVICKRIRERFPDSEMDSAKALLLTFKKLRDSSDSFWSKQPFTPSALASAGIFDRVLIEYELSSSSDDLSWMNESQEAQA